VFARGRMSEDRKSMPALEFYVMSKGDIAEKRERERGEWSKRGIAGTISAINAETKEITVDARTAEGPKPIVVATSGDTKFRRYAPDSIRFDDAKTGTFADLKAGDQLRALGTKSADGAALHAGRDRHRSISNHQRNDHRSRAEKKRSRSRIFRASNR
jgi:hypothetical protein